MESYRPIRNTIRRVRNRLAKVTVRHDLAMTGFLLSMLVTTLIWYEKKLYLDSGIRGLLIWTFTDLVMLAALVVVTANLTVDLLYGWLDPRIRYA